MGWAKNVGCTTGKGAHQVVQYENVSMSQNFFQNSTPVVRYDLKCIFKTFFLTIEIDINEKH